jgi:hypothetical protein
MPRFADSLLVCLVTVSLGACQPTQPPPNPPPTNPPTNPPPTTPPVHEPVRNKELMITDLSVVNDARATGPAGAWSFGGLITAMAGPTPPGTFVKQWLLVWDTNQTVNTFTVARRGSIRSTVIDPWKARDGQAGATDAAWTPNLANAPFRLLAIVNRLDLSRGDGADVVENAGEGRFVFGVTDNGGSPLPFTVIFEYEQIATDRAALRGWAQQWHALGTLPFGSGYNTALQQITDRFSGPNKAPAKPNGSALNQIRTNEIALNSPWELREFRIVGAALQEVPTAQSPDNSHQGTPRLAAFVNDNEADILDRNITIPLQFQSVAFRAGSSKVPVGFFWQAPGIANNEARHVVSFLSCNGCHHTETGTGTFLHVAPRAAGAEAALSGFLTGITVPDPVNAGTSRRFEDLKDRAENLKQLAGEPGTISLTAIRQARRARVH